ncbi:MAG: SMI1/KNR4 family protein [Isosphaeraceae bacterium]|nr:SMI1/KNR4 family protein [Isosphaeraceae bacterium]
MGRAFSVIVARWSVAGSAELGRSAPSHMSDPYVEMRAALPSSYIEYIEANNGWEGFLTGNDEYVVLWDKEAIAEHYDSYKMREYLDQRWFAFGSNGGGELLCFDLSSGIDSVYWLPFIEMSDEQPILRHKSFKDLAYGIERRV